MQPKNEPDQQPNKTPRRYKDPLQALTKADLELLILKRYISKLDVMRIFNLGETDFYEKVRSGCVVQVLFGSKKLYDLEAMYAKLEASKQNLPTGTHK